MLEVTAKGSVRVKPDGLAAEPILFRKSQMGGFGGLRALTDGEVSEEKWSRSRPKLSEYVSLHRSFSGREWHVSLEGLRGEPTAEQLDQVGQDFIAVASWLRRRPK